MRVNVKQGVFLATVVAGVVASVAIGGNVSLPHVFTAGTPAVAAQVNANFNAVKTAVDDNFSRIQGLETSRTSLQAGLADAGSRLGALERGQGPCPTGNPNDVMVRVGSVCIDKYEASVWSNPDGTGTQYGVAGNDYPATFPPSGNWSTPLYAVSRVNAIPSRSLTWFQAVQACAASGKRLISNAEWFTAAAGTPEANCNRTGNQIFSGEDLENGGCVSRWGVVNMVGNIWEMTADMTHGGSSTWGPPSVGSPLAARILDGGFGEDYMDGVNPPPLPAGTRFPAYYVHGGSSFDAQNAGPLATSLVNGLDNVSNLIGFRCAR